MTALTHQYGVQDQTPVMFIGQKDFPLVALEGAPVNGGTVANTQVPSSFLTAGMRSRGLPAVVTLDPTQATVSNSGRPSGLPKRSPPPPVSDLLGGSIDAMSQPSGVKWYVDGRYMGQTPGEYTGLDPGWHTIIMKKKGYKNWIGSIQISADSISQVVATLKKDKPARKWRNSGRIRNQRKSRVKSKKKTSPTYRRSGAIFKRGMESTGNRVTGWGLAAERD